jgi:predicted acyl esterase
MKVLLLVGLFLALALGRPPIKAPPRIDATYNRIHEMMKEEFGENPPVDPNGYSVHDVVMRDGIRLRTRVFIPRDYVPGEKRGAIFDRTPYGPGYTAMSLIWAFDGYVIVMQDQRGTFGSEGEFEIWRKDGQDAYDTCEWISQQEWSNGNVYTFGVSADANSVYPQILYNNPWIKAQFPVFGVDNGHRLSYPGGVHLKNLIEGWLNTVCTECIQDVRENEQDGEFWDPINMTSYYGNVHFPSIHWAGWSDIFLDHQIDAFNGYKKQGQPQIRDDTYLFVEPHGHCYDHVYYKGISLLALRIGRAIFKLQETGVRDPLLDEVTGLTLYVLGPQELGPLVPGNYFTSLEDWPVPQYTNYYLTADRKLQTLIPTNSTSSLSYKYDPTTSAPTIGGNNLFGSCGHLPQNQNEARTDYLTFTSDPLIRELAIVGRIEAVLYVSSTTNDTDFLVKITDVYPDGTSVLLQEGSIRMKWRVDKRSDPVLMVPGQIYQVTIEIWRIAMVFARNHSIRISITSSNNPRYEPNPNNGNLLIEGGDPVVTQNSIYVGRANPSHIILPVVEIDQIPPSKLFN